MVGCVGTMAAVYLKKLEMYVVWMKIIGMLTMMSVGSGVGLVIARGGQMAWAPFCVRLGVYLAVIMATEGWLYYQVSRVKVSRS